MTKQEYQLELKSPSWKSRRLEILERDNHKCRFCGSTESLQVHHLEYENRLCAWEYDDNKLITLCGNCHKKQHKGRLNIKAERAVQVYGENLSSFYKVLHGVSSNVLWGIISLLEYDTAMVYLTPKRRTELCNDLDISKQSFTNALSYLRKLCLIYGIDGEYMINPSIFWYGKKETRISILLSKDIQDKFRFTIED